MKIHTMKNGNGRLLALFLLSLTVGYGMFEARSLLQGPTLTILSPKIGELQTGDLMEIRGKTSHVTHVTINGKEATLDTSGTFSEKRVTPQGYGILVIEASNRFGQKVEEKIEFVGERNPITTPTTTLSTL